jgi:hypothetical protein
LILIAEPDGIIRGIQIIGKFETLSEAIDEALTTDHLIFN